ncbi:MAG: homoserine kinase [Actinomycetaceae bacterium]|nr:homoserine kinase [Arcanobacterium sp.]MDD7504984.1 homoserine kinase [Actinomycetaceae bacterium]MDY6143359.1 homoserine kinase [Arcanobacterium sp.]
MRIGNDHVRVRVPATSGNLGPGFDSMGMAHDVWDEVSVTLTTGPTKVVVLGEGSATLPKDGSHLIVRVMREVMDRLGLPLAGIELVCRNKIEQGKGLGSSAAAIVAGLMLVKGLLDNPDELSNEAMLDIATEYEGHPDNAAPAIYGGATLSWESAHGGVDTVPLVVHPEVQTSLLVPQEILPTAQARSVLPDQVPHRDAVLQASRAAMLVYALEHDPRLLLEATGEWLHQDYRADSMPKSIALLRALRDAGWPAVISGAGPSILVFSKIDSEMANAVARQGFAVVNSRQVQGAHIVQG